MSTIAETLQTAGQTTTTTLDAGEPYPGITLAQWHEIARIEARFGHVEPRLQRNGDVVVHVLGDRPERGFVRQPNGDYRLMKWPHIIVALAQSGAPLWATRPPIPSLADEDV